MFKSIQSKLQTFTLLLIVSVAGTTLLLALEKYIYAVPTVILMLFCLSQLRKHYSSYNRNIIFLLNALENGDYTYRFHEGKPTVREREMFQIFNRIKEILENARKGVIENEHFLSIILENVDTGIIIMDDRGVAQSVNRSALDMLGVPILSHIKQLQMVNPSYPSLFMDLQAGDSQQITLSNEKEEFKVGVHVSNILLKRGMMKVFTMNNIGNELELNELQSWTKLIRVMTHEIMNAIAPIKSLSETMQIMIKNEEKDTDYLKTSALEAFQTIRETATGLLTFVESYRKFLVVPKPEKQHLDLVKIIKRALLLNDVIIQEQHIEVKVSDNENVIVFADEKLLFQVLLNITKNAVEAMKNSESKRLEYNIIHLKNKVCIDICNSGALIPAEVLPSIFVPFFTTKEGGSGIGLSVSRYIMRLHGGTLHHFVTKDGMTAFRVEIPEN
ncbi:MAG: ATP-binding protein [Tannerella sp.]|jgi:nitrogen fixation/metabolism regulation signal transduction histidine kinase|nr:ATP-binding protein [Tannerella sp.]